jgi:hypothetical protein
MKSYVYWLLLGAWGVMGFALQGAALQARGPNGSDVVELGGLKSRAPADWAEQVCYDPHCTKQYRLEPVNDDAEYAYVSVYFLGKGKVATAAEYVKGWKGMFLPPEGQTMKEAAKVRHFKLSGASVTFLDVHGDYKGISGDQATRRENYRLLGVYFATPRGVYAIDLFGPADTVEVYRRQFENWVKAFK